MKLKFSMNPFEALNPVTLEGDEGGGGAPAGKTYPEEYVRGLRQEAAKHRTRLRELEERLGKADHVNFEEYEQLKREREESEQKGIDSRRDLDRIEEGHKAELSRKNEEISALKARLGSLDAELSRTILESAVTAEAAAARCLNPRLLAMQLASEARVETAEDGRRVVRLFGPDGSEVLNGSGNPMSLGERIAAMKQDERFAMLFDGGAYGAGSNPMAGGGRSLKNPFQREHYNLTEQGRLLRENPELARRLAAEAGVRLYGPK